MDRARATHLIPGSLAGHEAEQFEHFGHGDPGPDLGEANTRHDGGPQDPDRGRRGPSGEAVTDGSADREEEPVRAPRGLQGGLTGQIHILTNIRIRCAKRRDEGVDCGGFVSCRPATDQLSLACCPRATDQYPLVSPAQVLCVAPDESTEAGPGRGRRRNTRLSTREQHSANRGHLWPELERRQANSREKTDVATGGSHFAETRSFRTGALLAEKVVPSQTVTDRPVPGVSRRACRRA